MTLAASYKYQGDYYWNNLNLEVRCGSQLIAEKRVESPVGDGPTITQPDNVAG